MIHKFLLRFHRPRTNSFLTFDVKATYLGEAKNYAFHKFGEAWVLLDWEVNE